MPAGSCRRTRRRESARARSEDLRGGIGRAVVDRDHLEVRERLRRQRVEALGEERLLVPHR
jgi:hypothetical protein